MKVNRIFAVISCLALVLPLAGCYDNREIDETGYVIAMGIDKTDTDGMLRYTFQFSNPLAVGGDEEGGIGGDKGKSSESEGEVWDSGNPTVNNVTVEAPDYYIACSLLGNFMSKRPNLSHIKLIVFSAEVAREGILQQAQIIMQEREIRPDTALAAAPDGAEAFLKSVNPKLEESTAKYYELLLDNKSMAYAPITSLSEFVNSVSGSGRSAVLPLAGVSRSKEKLRSFTNSADAKNAGFSAGDIPRLSAEKSEFIGMAVFKGDKMQGGMSGSDALMYRVLCGDVKAAFLSVPDIYDAHKDLTVQLRTAQKPRYCIDLSRTAPKVKIGLGINADCAAAQLSDSYDNYNELEEYIKRILEEKLLDFLRRTQREYDADVLGLGDIAKRQCTTWEQWEQLNDSGWFNKAEFDVDLNIKIRRSGTMLPISME